MAAEKLCYTQGSPHFFTFSFICGHSNGLGVLWQDNFGRAAMDYARDRRHDQVIELLEMAKIRIEMRAKRLADEDRMVELVECSQVIVTRSRYDTDCC